MKVLLSGNPRNANKMSVHKVSTRWVDNRCVHFTLLFQTFVVWGGTSACKGLLQAAAISPYMTSPTPVLPHTLTKDRHNTGNFVPYSYWIACGFVNVPYWTYQHGRYCVAGPTLYLKSINRYRAICTTWTAYIQQDILSTWFIQSIAWQCFVNISKGLKSADLNLFAWLSEIGWVMLNDYVMQSTKFRVEQILASGGYLCG